MSLLLVIKKRSTGTTVTIPTDDAPVIVSVSYNNSELTFTGFEAEVIDGELIITDSKGHVFELVNSELVYS